MFYNISVKDKYLIMEIKMIFATLKLNDKDPIYTQLQTHINEGVKKGELKKGSKLPSTREASKFLGISRNSVISAYEELESRGVITTKRGIGTFVNIEVENNTTFYNINYRQYVNSYGLSLYEEDIIKNEPHYKKGMISFKSIAPDPCLFNMEDFKRALLDALSKEETNLLNYGYAKGYAPLIKYLETYMSEKGVSLDNKSILITNGFTEAFDLVISTLTKPGDIIICEEPTHNTALKIMKAHGLIPLQIPLNKDGMNLRALEHALKSKHPAFGYIIPSYNNPTGIVTKGAKRKKIYDLFMKYSVPVIEDGFNEELLYSSSPLQPVAAYAGSGNGCIYLGSLSKVLFPGLRIGWILADEKLIDILESAKRGRNIHCSFLDQSTLYNYFINGSFSKYIKAVKKYYKEKYHLIKELTSKYIEYDDILGEGGLHIFIKLKYKVSARKLLELCYNEGVLFMPGDIFYADSSHEDTLRLGFGRISNEDMEKGIKIIGEKLDELYQKNTTV